LLIVALAAIGITYAATSSVGRRNI
jgi:hypothetical protein